MVIVVFWFFQTTSEWLKKKKQRRSDSIDEYQAYNDLYRKKTGTCWKLTHISDGTSNITFNKTIVAGQQDIMLTGIGWIINNHFKTCCKGQPFCLIWTINCGCMRKIPTLVLYHPKHITHLHGPLSSGKQLSLPHFLSIFHCLYLCGLFKPQTVKSLKSSVFRICLQMRNGMMPVQSCTTLDVSSNYFLDNRIFTTTPHHQCDSNLPTTDPFSSPHVIRGGKEFLCSYVHMYV